MTVHLNYWTPVKYGDQAAHFGHRLLEFADGYFNHSEIVALVLPGVMHKDSAGVKLQQENPPLWQTILKIITYATVIIPVIMLCAKWILRSLYPFHICSRILPDGAEEIGTFVNRTLEQGVRIEREQIIYIKPKLLLEESAAVNFAQVMIDGKNTIIPVHGKKGTNDYIPCEDSAIATLFKMIDEDSSILEQIFNQPDQEQFLQEFFQSLLSPNEYGQTSLTARLFEKSESVLAILKQAVKHSIPITPEIIDELFIQSVGTGSAELTELILHLRPEAIEKMNSCLSVAAVNGSAEEIEILLKVIKERNIPLDLWDTWLYKAYANDCDFTNEEFSALQAELREEIYEVANVFLRRAFLIKIRPLQIYEPPILPDDGHLFSPTMDGVDVENAIYDFLVNLRKQGALLTEKEFNQIDPHRFEEEHPSTSLSSIYMRNYMQGIAENRNLNFLKFQKRIAVFKPKDDNGRSIDIVIGEWPNWSIHSDDLNIYLEKITPIDRKATREEIAVLLDILENTGFHIYPNTVRILMGKNPDGDEGIYFEHMVYYQIQRSPDFYKMNALLELMAEEDHAWFRAELQRRKEIFEPSEIDFEEEGENEEIAIRHGFNIQRTLKVPIGNIGLT